MDSDTGGDAKGSASLSATLEEETAADTADMAAGMRESIALHCRDEGVTSSGSDLNPWERPPFPPKAPVAASMLPPLPRRLRPPPRDLETMQAEIAALMLQLGQLRQPDVNNTIELPTLDPATAAPALQELPAVSEATALLGRGDIAGDSMLVDAAAAAALLVGSATPQAVSGRLPETIQAPSAAACSAVSSAGMPKAMPQISWRCMLLCSSEGMQLSC